MPELKLGTLLFAVITPSFEAGYFLGASSGFIAVISVSCL